jgi:hypothetical protein
MPAAWTDELRAYVTRWFEHPLGRDDGNTDIELARAAADLGIPMPGALRAWYGLVGRRLRPVQDTPVLLDELSEVRDEERAALPFWIENQGVWRLEVPATPQDDPAVEALADFPQWPGGSLSAVLLAMLVSETLMAGSLGTLGALAPWVAVEYLMDSTLEQDTRIRSALGPVATITNPSFDEPMLGDAHLVFRYDQVGWSWMASGDDAIRRARALVGDPGPVR